MVRERVDPPCSGYESLTEHITTLLTTYPPSFMYVYDPELPKSSAAVIHSVLSSLSGSELNLYLSYACVNAVACFTPRLFYDTVINGLAKWTPAWNNGCANWPGPSGDGRWNESLDTFINGLRTVCSQMVDENDQPSGSRNKGKARAIEDNVYRLVIAIERAERLKDNLPDLLVPLTRLDELSQVEVVVILISNVRWEDIRPPLGASLDPFYIDVPALSRPAILEMLANWYLEASSTVQSSSLTVDPDVYHPALQPLYLHFLETLYSVCSPFTRDPYELGYIAAARWSGFVQPVLDMHRRNMDARAPADDEDRMMSEDQDPNDMIPQFTLPSEDIRIRLTRMFTPSFTVALETLYPRFTNAAQWARAHMPPADLLTIPPALVSQVFDSGASAEQNDTLSRSVDELPRLAKFVLVGAFVASTNPPKTDLRMFGRGLDERAKRQRRKGGGPRKNKAAISRATKIPQRLLGPTAFTLDRLLAIVGVLLEENDADSRPTNPLFKLPGEYTEMEISRVALHAQVIQLASMRLLMRTTPLEKLDTVPTFKCGILYEVAMRLAREIGIILNDLLWESL